MIALLVAGPDLPARSMGCAPMLGEFTPTSQRGAVIAIYGAIYTLAGILAPLVMGSMIQHAATPIEGYMTGFVINGVILIASGVLGLLLLWPNTELARLWHRRRSRKRLKWLVIGCIASAPQEIPTRSRSTELRRPRLGAGRRRFCRRGDPRSRIGAPAPTRWAKCRCSRSTAAHVAVGCDTAVAGGNHRPVRARPTINASRRCAGCFSTITNSPTTTRCTGFRIVSCRSRCIRPSWHYCVARPKRVRDRRQASRRIAPSCSATGRPSWISRWPDSLLPRRRRPASISRRSIRRSMPGAGALPRCPAGSRPTN